MTVAAMGEVALGVPRGDAERATALLRACLAVPGSSAAESLPEHLARASSSAVVALARYHGVLGLAFEPLAAAGAEPSPLLEAARDAFEASVHRHLRATWELAQVRKVLDPTGVPWVVVKGPAAVELLYAGRGGRAYVDLDLLVHPSGFGGVIEALEAGGFAIEDRNWAILRKELRGEVHHRGPSGLEIDLHWNLVNMYRGRMRVPSGALLERTQRVTLAGVGVRTLDPTDSLIHLCLHAAISGGDRMVWLKDIERSVTTRPPDWGAVVERCAEWSVSAPVGLMLERSAAFLGWTVPRAARRRLLGGAARALVGTVDRLFPWPRALGRLASPNRLIARSVGQGLLGAGSWLVVRSVRNLDSGQELANSAFTPGGDAGDRAAFIAAVEASEAAWRQTR